MINNKLSEEIVIETLELMLRNANTEQHFSTVKYAINDYIDEGYNIKIYISRYNEKYQQFIGKGEK